MRKFTIPELGASFQPILSDIIGAGAEHGERVNIIFEVEEEKKEGGGT